MFGSRGLPVEGTVFAMLVKGDLVVKLPREQVALVADRAGKPFDPGHGRLMKEWVAMPPDAEVDWANLARAAREFVGRRSR